jgi:hypothetical protein
VVEVLVVVVIVVVIVVLMVEVVVAVVLSGIIVLALKLNKHSHHLSVLFKIINFFHSIV